MPPRPNDPRPIREALPALLLLTAVFLFNFLSRVVLAPLLPEVRADLGMTNTEAGSFFLVMAAGVGTGLVASGFVSARLTHRRTIALSATLLGCALMGASMAGNMVVFRLLWAAAGFGAGLYLPSGFSTLTAMVERRHWGRALAVHEMAPNGSFILAPLAAELALAVADWRTALFVLGACQLVLAVSFLRGCGSGAFRGTPPSGAVARRILSGRAFWVMTALFTLGVLGSFGPYAMIPVYLVDLGWSRTDANHLLTVSRVLAFGMPFASGWLVDRIGAKRTIGGFLLLAGSACIFLGLAPAGGWLVAAVLVQPMVAVTFFPAAFSSLSQLYSPEERNVAVSFLVPFAMFTGIGAGPTLLGFMGDLGSFGAGFAIVGALVLCGLAVLPALRLPRQE